MLQVCLQPVSELHVACSRVVAISGPWEEGWGQQDFRAVFGESPEQKLNATDGEASGRTEDESSGRQGA